MMTIHENQIYFLMVFGGFGGCDPSPPPSPARGEGFAAAPLPGQQGYVVKVARSSSLTVMAAATPTLSDSLLWPWRGAAGMSRR